MARFYHGFAYRIWENGLAIISHLRELQGTFFDKANETMPETLRMAFVSQRPFHGAAYVGYFCAFIGLINSGIPDSNHVPMHGRDGAILLGSYPAFIDPGFIAEAIVAAFVIQQLHRSSGCSLGQYDSEPVKAGRICDPRQTPERITRYPSNGLVTTRRGSYSRSRSQAITWLESAVGS